MIYDADGKEVFRKYRRTITSMFDICIRYTLDTHFWKNVVISTIADAQLTAFQ